MASPSQSAPAPAGPRLPTAWIRIGAGVAAAGYTALALALHSGEYSRDAYLRQWLTALAACVALLLSFRRPRLAALLLLGVVWGELTYSFYEAGRVLSVNAIAYPAVVVAAGLFAGGTGAMTMSVACAVALPLAIYLSGAWGRGLPQLSAGDLRALIVVETLVLGLGLLMRSAMNAYGVLLQRSDRDRQRYLALFEHAADGLVALDEGDRITEVNAVTERLLDAPREWLRGVRFDDALRAAGAEPGFDLGTAREAAPAPVSLRRPTGPPRALEISARTSFGDGEAAGALRVEVREAGVRG